MFLQLNENLLLKKLTFEEVREHKLPERETKSVRAPELFNSFKTKTEKARNDFMFRTARIVNTTDMQIDFTKTFGLYEDHVEICR